MTNRSGTISRPLIAPDELDTRLRFRKIGTLTNGAAPIAAVELRPNCAYDVDPLVGSTETYGFDEYAALYSYYRVVGYSYRISIVSMNMTGGVMVYLMNSNITLPGTNYALYSTNPYSQSTLLAGYGAKPTVLTGSISVAKLTGTPAVETADTFRATTTTVPADQIFLTLAAEGFDGAGALTGVTYDIQLTMDIRFYSREVDLTLTGFMSRLEKYKQSRIELLTSKLRPFGAPLSHSGDTAAEKRIADERKQNTTNKLQLPDAPTSAAPIGAEKPSAYNAGRQEVDGGDTPSPEALAMALRLLGQLANKN